MNIPYIVYESEMARQERFSRRLIAIIIILIILLTASNVGWLIYTSQFDDEITTSQVVEQDAENGSNQFVGGNYYGEAKSNNNYD